MSSGRSRRAVQAAETQQLILNAALKLFISKGYGASSIADIAAEAGVAVPTVYTSVGPKPQLLRRLIDWVDEQADIPALAAELLASHDPATVLGLQVTITRQLAERCGDILAALASAAQVDEDLAKMYAEGHSRHIDGSHKTAERIEQLGGLRADLTAEHAAAILGTLTLPVNWATLTRDYAWSFDDAEGWIFETLREQLLAS
ncbi:MAG TPA: helix-turn-helix domain-containing protein [Nitrolancea sp.]|jgi:AcrR family transcriptional regulator|nr:helix-turn-helix domain-containing protein [Nitrolancea sp.]